jgi:hypothetical protein
VIATGLPETAPVYTVPTIAFVLVTVAAVRV